MRIIFYRSRSVLGKIVQLVTKSEYSHVGIMLDNNHITDVSFGGRVMCRHIKLNKKEYEIIEYDFEFNYDEYYRLLGVKWDIIGALYYVLPFLHNPKESLTCAEYVAHMIGLEQVLTPKELYEIIKNKESKLK
jgi:hypothetical protein